MKGFHRLHSNWAVGGALSSMMSPGYHRAADRRIHHWGLIGLQKFWWIPIARFEWLSDVDKQARLDAAAEQLMAVTPPCLGPFLSLLLLLLLPFCLLDPSSLFSNLDGVRDSQTRTYPLFEHLVSHLWISRSDELQADGP